MNRDKLIRALGEAIEDASLSLIGQDLGTAFRDDIAGAGLDAVLPLIEADLRESIAREIEAANVIDSQGQRRDGKRMKAHAASIARGGSA